MKITHISSAAVLIENKGTKVLCDPWLVGDEYYGSWTVHPPLNDVDFSIFDDVDYIYISHIHPDHLSEETLKKIKKDIPVLIHKYDEPFLKRNLTRLGRNVIELKHGEKFECGAGLNIYIYASDDCNPEICFKFFGCGKSKSVDGGSTGIDTMSVFESSDHCILNVNDCPYELSKTALSRVLTNHKSVDLLLVGYAGAGSYPQCWSCYSDDDKLSKYGVKKKNHFLNMGLDYINQVQPKYYMPFAGTYVLSGRNAKLERFRVVPTLDEALDFYKEKNNSSKGLLLNSFSSFDLNDESIPEYKPLDREAQIKYCEEVLINKKYIFDKDEEPSLSSIISLIPEAYNRYNKKREELAFSTNTNIYIYLPEEKMLKISADGSGYDVINNVDFNDERFVSYKLNFKLLYRIFRGPKHAHWNNAEIGSHIEFFRKPEVYERKLYYSMNFFHS